LRPTWPGDAEDVRLEEDRRARQREFDRQLAPLLNHEETAALASLHELFVGFPHEVVAIVPTTSGSLVLIVYDERGVPYGEPSFTPSGKLTVRKLSQTARNHLRHEGVAAATDNAARQALAATPGSSSATAVTLRRTTVGLEPIAWLR
jgi:hypothetical protein